MSEKEKIIRPRFDPDQEVWMMSEDGPYCGDICEIIWQPDWIQYEVSTMNDLGHQVSIYYEESSEKQALIFPTEDECINHYKK